MARFYYYLAPAIWHDDECGYFSAPDGARGMIDLRRLPDYEPGQSRGCVFCWSAAPLGDASFALLADPGDCRELPLTAAAASAWRSFTGYLPQGERLVDAVVDALTNGADPLGLDFCKPLVPTSELDLEVWMPGHSRVYARQFAWGRDPHTNRLRDLLRADAKAGAAMLREEEKRLRAVARDLRKAKNGAAAAAVDGFADRLANDKQAGKCVAFEALKYGIDPSEINADVAPQKPSTSISDDFSTNTIANYTAEGTSTWAISGGAIKRTNTSASYSNVRHNTSLSGSDNLARAYVDNFTIGPACRKSASANSYGYMTFLNGWTSQNISSIVNGTRSNLGNLTATFVAGNISVSAVGSTITYGQATTTSITNTAVSSGTYAGLCAVNYNRNIDNFYAEDVGDVSSASSASSLSSLSSASSESSSSADSSSRSSSSRSSSSRSSSSRSSSSVSSASSSASSLSSLSTLSSLSSASSVSSSPSSASSTSPSSQSAAGGFYVNGEGCEPNPQGTYCPDGLFFDGANYWPKWSLAGTEFFIWHDTLYDFWYIGFNGWSVNLWFLEGSATGVGAYSPMGGGSGAPIVSATACGGDVSSVSSSSPSSNSTAALAQSSSSRSSSTLSSLSSSSSLSSLSSVTGIPALIVDATGCSPDVGGTYCRTGYIGGYPAYTLAGGQYHIESGDGERWYLYDDLAGVAPFYCYPSADGSGGYAPFMGGTGNPTAAMSWCPEVASSSSMSSASTLSSLSSASSVSSISSSSVSTGSSASSLSSGSSSSRSSPSSPSSASSASSSTRSSQSSASSASSASSLSSSSRSTASSLSSLSSSSRSSASSASSVSSSSRSTASSASSASSSSKSSQSSQSASSRSSASSPSSQSGSSQSSASSASSSSRSSQSSASSMSSSSLSSPSSASSASSVSSSASSLSSSSRSSPSSQSSASSISSSSRSSPSSASSLSSLSSLSSHSSASSSTRSSASSLSSLSSPSSASSASSLSSLSSSSSVSSRSSSSLSSLSSSSVSSLSSVTEVSSASSASSVSSSTAGLGLYPVSVTVGLECRKNVAPNAVAMTVVCSEGRAVVSTSGGRTVEVRPTSEGAVTVTIPFEPGG